MEHLFELKYKYLLSCMKADEDVRKCTSTLFMVSLIMVSVAQAV